MSTMVVFGQAELGSLHRRLEQLEFSDLDLTVCGTADSVMMVEGGLLELDLSGRGVRGEPGGVRGARPVSPGGRV